MPFYQRHTCTNYNYVYFCIFLKSLNSRHNPVYDVLLFFVFLITCNYG